MRMEVIGLWVSPLAFLAWYRAFLIINAAYARPTWPTDVRDSSVPTSHLSIGPLGLKCTLTHLASTSALGICTQVFTHVWQAIYSLSHLPSPQLASFCLFVSCFLFFENFVQWADHIYLHPPSASGSTHFPLPTQICPLVHEMSHRWWHLFLLTWASPFYIGLGQRWCLACSCLWLEWSAHPWLSECHLCMASLAADFPTSLQGSFPWWCFTDSRWLSQPAF